MKYFLYKIHLFYHQYPISQYALAQISGALLSSNNIYGIFILSFILITTKSKNITLLLLFFLLPLPITQKFYNTPHKNSSITGQGIFVPYSKLLIKKNLWKIQGKLLFFTDNSKKEKFKNIDCLTYSKNNFSLYKNYKIFGKLTKKHNNHYFSISSIELIKNKLNIKNVGLYFNEKLSQYIDKYFDRKNVNSFLKAIFLGHPLICETKQNFQKLGISHMLIISGFHFNLIVCICSILFYFLPYKTKFLTIFIVITSFILILLPSPSITRAWITCSLTIIANILSLSCSSIDKLSISSLIILTINPLNISNTSFQFSFLATLGIILFYPIIKRTLYRNIKEKENLSKGKKIYFKIINQMSNYIAITISAQIFILPLSISNFHCFYLGTFFYNILFSPLIQISLILFLLSCILRMTYLFSLTSSYISWILHIADNPPINFKTLWIFSNISEFWIFIYFIVTFCIGIIAFLNQESKLKNISKFNKLLDA